MLGKLNNDNIGNKNFKANPGIISGNLIIYL
jgi:hypothetical protein